MPPCKSSYSLVTLCSEVKRALDAVNFLIFHKILNKTAECKKCGTELSEQCHKPGTAYYYFPCHKCKTMVSIRDGTILSHSNIGIRTFIMLTYTFVMFSGLTLAQKIHEADLNDGDYDDLVVPGSGDPHLSEHTIIEYQAVFRDVIADHMMSEAGGYLVGGPGTTIEIDESMFGEYIVSLITVTSIWQQRFLAPDSFF